jgi:hypothetical protein|tara:strand:+ start:610 stop:768 length:159 start_codon:yes stop_codon:yes gene_type:complete
VHFLFGIGVLFSIISKGNDFVVSGSDGTTRELLKVDASENQFWRCVVGLVNE